ncbi:MAG: hypothetical protein WCK71_03220 [bacterium]
MNNEPNETQPSQSPAENDGRAKLADELDAIVQQNEQSPGAFTAEPSIAESQDASEIAKTLFGSEHQPTVQLVPISEFVIQRVNTYSERGSDKSGRLIFEMGDKSFSFKSIAESPTYPTQTRTHTTLIGESSSVLEESGKDTHQQYQSEVAKITPDKADDKEHFTVDRSLKGILQLAQQIIPSDTAIGEMLSEINEGVYSDRALLLLDAIAATTCMDEAGNMGKLDPYGDAMIILALSGDAAAQAQISSRVAKLHEIDSVTASEDVASIADHYAKYPLIEDGQEKVLPLAQLSMVHTSKFPPLRDESGQVIIKTRFDAQGFSRASLHFTVNHLVKAHLYGSWDESPFVVVAPLKGMLEQNGKPRALGGIDSWWLRNPGQPVECPGAIVIAPNAREGAPLLESLRDEIRYKTKDYSEQDIEEMLTGMFESQTIAWSDLPPEVQEAIAVIDSEFKTATYHFNSEYYVDERNKIISAVNSVYQNNKDNMDIEFCYISKQLAFLEALKLQGAPPTVSYQWDTSIEGSINRVARDLVVTPRLHADSSEAYFESRYWRNIDFDDEVFGIGKDLDPQTRRAVLASGVMPTRQTITQKLNDLGF